MDREWPEPLFGYDWKTRISTIAELTPGLVRYDTDQMPLDRIEVLLTCWGCPPLTATLLDRMPSLTTVVHAAGTIKGIATQEAQRRGLIFSSGADLNAQPVAEYTLGAILLSGKRAFELREAYRTTGQRRAHPERHWGIHGMTVGIVGASRTGRQLIRLLQPFDVDLLVYDPTLTEEVPGTKSVSLGDLMAESDVVSVHAPSLPETRHIIDRHALSQMRDGATLINTSRGALIDEVSLLAELQNGRLFAVLDVTDDDLLKPGAPLLTEPHAFVTPHIAGSVGDEIGRLGDGAIEELTRLTRGEALARRVYDHELARMA